MFPTISSKKILFFFFGVKVGKDILRYTYILNLYTIYIPETILLSPS